MTRSRIIGGLLCSLFLSSLAAHGAASPGRRGGKGAAAAKAPAAAIDRCGPQQQDPAKLAEEGLRLYEEALTKIAPRDEKAAIRQFEISVRCYLSAIAVSKEPARIFHPLGLVYFRLGRYPEALEAFKRFMAAVPESSRNPGVTRGIDDKLTKLRQHVAELDIDTLPGLEVRVDNRLVGKAPIQRTVAVMPGKHSVVAGGSDIGTVGADISVEAGDVRRVDLTAWTRREAPPPVAPPPPPRAYLTVKANRQGAALEVDGAASGQTPLAQLQLVPGPHVLLARDDGRVLRREFALAKDEQRTIELRFPVKRWVWIATGLAAGAVVATAVGVGIYYGTGVDRPDKELRFP